LGADREESSAGSFSEYKIGGSNVYMREPPNPLPYTSVNRKENKSIETGNRDDAFVFWRGYLGQKAVRKQGRDIRLSRYALTNVRASA
jgi:hypothetical protein